MYILTAKLALSILGCLAAWLAGTSARWRALPPDRFLRVSWVLLAAARLGLFCAVFVVLRFAAHADVTVYYDEARSVLAGKTPVLDFFTPYSPPFPYLAAGPVLLWDSPKSIILLSIVLELIAYPLWNIVGRRTFSEDVVRVASAIYIFGPLTAVNVTLSGQNHVWLSLFLAISLALLLSGRAVASGLTFGAGVALVKFLSLVHAPVLWVMARHRCRWTAGFVLLPVAVCGAWYALGGDLVRNLAFHASDISSGNLPFLLSAAGLDIASPAGNTAISALALLVLGLVFLIPVLRHRGLSEAQALHMIAALAFVMLVVCKKTYPGYLIMSAFACWLSLAARLGPRRGHLWACVTVLSILGTCESSLWFRLTDAVTFVGSRSAATYARPEQLGFLIVVDVLLVATYCVCTFVIWRPLAGGGSLDVADSQPDLTCLGGEARDGVRAGSL